MKLFREVQAHAEPDDLTIERLLGKILSHAARTSERDSLRIPPWLPRILDKLKTEHCRRLALDELAREVGVPQRQVWNGNCSCRRRTNAQNRGGRR